MKQWISMAEVQQEEDENIRKQTDKYSLSVTLIVATPGRRMRIFLTI